MTTLTEDEVNYLVALADDNVLSKVSLEILSKLVEEWREQNIRWTVSADRDRSSRWALLDRGKPTSVGSYGKGAIEKIAALLNSVEERCRE